MKSGAGYWLVASDGGVFNFGHVPFFGSTGSFPTEPAEKLVPARGDSGYWVVDQNGTAYPFGNASGAPPATALLFSDVTQGTARSCSRSNNWASLISGAGTGRWATTVQGLPSLRGRTVRGSVSHGSQRPVHDCGEPVSLVGPEAGDLVFWGTSQTER